MVNMPGALDEFGGARGDAPPGPGRSPEPNLPGSHALRPEAVPSLVKSQGWLRSLESFVADPAVIDLPEVEAEWRPDPPVPSTRRRSRSSGQPPSHCRPHSCTLGLVPLPGLRGWLWRPARAAVRTDDRRSDGGLPTCNPHIRTGEASGASRSRACPIRMPSLPAGSPRMRPSLISSTCCMACRRA